MAEHKSLFFFLNIMSLFSLWKKKLYTLYPISVNNKTYIDAVPILFEGLCGKIIF